MRRTEFFVLIFGVGKENFWSSLCYNAQFILLYSLFLVVSLFQRIPDFQEKKESWESAGCNNIIILFLSNLFLYNTKLEMNEDPGRKIALSSSGLVTNVMYNFVSLRFPFIMY